MVRGSYIGFVPLGGWGIVLKKSLKLGIEEISNGPWYIMWSLYTIYTVRNEPSTV